MMSNERLPGSIVGLGAVLSVLVVWVGESIVGMGLGADEIVPRVVRTLLAFLPFLILAVSASGWLREGGPGGRSEVLGATTLVTVGYVVLWGWYLFEAARPAAGGANIGMGIVMLFSPVLLAALILPGRWLGRRLFLPRAIHGDTGGQ